MGHRNEFDYKEMDLQNPIQFCSDMITQNAIQFEYKITYIGAGAITAILIYANSHILYKWILIIGLIILLFAVLLNLYSYMWFNDLLAKDLDLFIALRNGLKYKNGRPLSSCYYEQNKDIIEKSCADFHKYIDDRVVKRSNKADFFNKWNLYVLFLGLAAIAIYVILNIIEGT